MTNDKAYLRQLKRNLNALEERAANWGRSAPVELLNQIEDHRRAIALTEQVIADERSQAEWREGLRRLNVDQPVAAAGLSAVFDQSGQQVGTQFNVAGDLNLGPEARVPWQRPPRAVHFTNREQELAQLLADLRPGRVVTLCGPGGDHAALPRRYPLSQLLHPARPGPGPGKHRPQFG